MLRKRLATLALTASLTLASGCSSCCSFSDWTSSLFHRQSSCCQQSEPCGSPCCGGAAMDEGGPYLGAPTGAGMPPAGPGTCVGPAGPGPGRIVPQPAAQPDPYTPTRAQPRLLSAFEK
jgi:hypothetical protein